MPRLQAPLPRTTGKKRTMNHRAGVIDAALATGRHHSRRVCLIGSPLFTGRAS